MKLEEIQTILLSRLIDKPFSLLWSGDDRISLYLERGLEVLDFVPDPNSSNKRLCLHRSWVTPSDEMPTLDVGIDVNVMFWNLRQQNLHHLIEDVYLAPKLVTTALSPPYIAQVAWSPQGMLRYGRCLLATLTNYGCLLIQAQQGKKWLTIVDISLLWKNYCSESWKSTKNAKPDKQFKELQKRVGRLRITNITWSEIMTDEYAEVAFLITGAQNGEVAIWQLKVVQNINDVHLEPKLNLVFNSGLTRITAMLWINISHNKAFLCLGDMQGCIKIFTFDINGHEISNVSSMDLWTEKDRLAVGKFLLLSLNASSVMLLAVKETFLFAFYILEHTIAASSQLFGNFAIYGIEKLDEETVLLAAYYLSLQKIRIIKNENEINFETLTISHDKNSNYGYYGLAASRNKAIWAVSASMSQQFDHLVLKSPAQILFFTFPECVKSYAKLKNNPTQSLTNYWDCLELIRIQGTVMSHLDVDMNKFDTLDFYQLRLRYWLTKFALQNENTEEEMCNELQKQVQETSKYFLLQHMCKLAKKFISKVPYLSETEQESLSFMYNWLHRACIDMNIGESLKACVTHLLESIKQEFLKEEYCALCKSKCIEQSSAIEMQCPLGHTLPRCSISFVQCSELPYWFCRVCNSLACKNVELIEEPVCIYCNSFMHLDHKLIVQ